MGTKTLLEKLKWISAKSVWLGFVILLGISVYAGAVEFSRGMSLNSILPLILMFVFFSFLTLIHEMGHALAAWGCKCRVHFIAVGKFGFDPENRKFQKCPNEVGGKIDGFVEYSPSWPVSNRWAELIVSFSGPLITLILGFGLLYHFLSFGYDPSYPNANTGYMWLGFACVLHTIVNLMPMKISDTLDTDGRNIWNSLFKSCWTLKNWMESRAYVSGAYRQEIASDEEWLLLRCHVLASKENVTSMKDVFRYFAWAKTDPEAFMAVIDNGAGHIVWLPKKIQYQYVCSAVLMGKYKPGLGRLVPQVVDNDTEDPNSILWHFAVVLKAHAEGSLADRWTAVAAARKAYIAAYGEVGVEEDAIFSAVENGTTLPPMKWPALKAEIKPRAFCETPIGEVVVS